MKKLAKRNLRTVVIAAALGLFTLSVNAQPPGPPTGPGGEPPETLPINGLIGIALVAGAAFGIKKLKGNKAE
ncbi:MAG TPA: hypothetical protein VFM82_05585 [Flavobacteriaceae bacterium]|nr:hypothetical protein [Flavobacteriaceae bacterium]